VATDTLQRRFVRLSCINLLANITVPLAGLVDTAMLGHLDNLRFLAGVGLGAVLFDYLYWSLGFLRMGTTGITAQASGRRDPHEVTLALLRPALLAFVAAGAILLLQWPLRELGFSLLSGEAGVEAAGRDYFNARVWGAPATLGSFVLIGWFLGREQSRRVLFMTVVANLVNVALNYLFIVRLGLAARGAGLATMISQYVMLAVGLALLRTQWGHSTGSLWSELFDHEKMRALLRFNRDLLLRTLCLVTSFAIFVNFGALLGTTLLAANLILYRLFILAANLIDGAALAAESLAGIFRGERNLASLRRVIRLSMITGVAFSILFLGAFFVARGFWLGLLTSHEDVVRLASSYSLWLVPVMLLGSVAFMYDGLFIGLTEGRALRNAMLLSALVFFLLPAVVAVWLSSNHLLWLAMAVFMAARAATLAHQMTRLLNRYCAW